jgi:hypothetical protein
MPGDRGRPIQAGKKVKLSNHLRRVLRLKVRGVYTHAIYTRSWSVVKHGIKFMLPVVVSYFFSILTFSATLRSLKWGHIGSQLTSISNAERLSAMREVDKVKLSRYTPWRHMGGEEV